MAKGKVDTKVDPNQDGKSNPAIILEIVESLGRDAVSDDAVRDSLKRDYKGIELSASTLKQYVYAARKKLGWVKARGGAASSTRSGVEPTLTDLMNARKLAESVDMTPEKLLDLVHTLSNFGDTETLTACLEALVELSD